MPREEMKTRLESNVKKLRMENLLGRNLFRMSGGEKQKVACACADTSDAPVIVLDEPSSNLDLHSIRELADIIEQWKKNGKTVIVAEHRLYYMLPFADRLLNILQPLLANEEADDSENTKDFAALMEEIKKIYGAKFPSLEKKIKQFRYFHIVREETQYLWETLFCILRRCLKRANELLLGNSDYEHGIANLFYDAAIVAREFGLPAVLGTGFATRRFSDGQNIRVDGDKGEVYAV